MANVNLAEHRQWEDWASMGLGLLIVISPWLTERPPTEAALLNTMIVGLLVLCIGALELAFLRRWEEWIELALGVWLVISPWLFGYSQLALITSAHVVLGALVAAIAALELWQDRNPTQRMA